MQREAYLGLPLFITLRGDKMLFRFLNWLLREVLRLPLGQGPRFLEVKFLSKESPNLVTVGVSERVGPDGLKLIDLIVKQISYYRNPDFHGEPEKIELSVRVIPDPWVYWRLPEDILTPEWFNETPAPIVLPVQLVAGKYVFVEPEIAAAYIDKVVDYVLKVKHLVGGHEVVEDSERNGSNPRDPTSSRTAACSYQKSFGHQSP